MQEAFFVRSASPGAVLRFLERLARRGEVLPAEVLISDAVGDALWRALPSTGLETVAARLALAFPPDVFQLQKNADSWHWMRYTHEGLVESGTLAHKRLWQHQAPVVLWARTQGLPLTRLTHPPKTLDYETVAQLDQRSLLHEDTPRLYRFSLTPQTQSG